MPSMPFLRAFLPGQRRAPARAVAGALLLACLAGSIGYRSGAAQEPPVPVLPEPVAPPAPVTSGEVRAGVPVDGGAVAEPMYVPDPIDRGAYAAIPEAVPSDFDPDWPRWFAGATGLVMTRTLPSGAATMQPAAGLPTLSTASAGATWPGGVDFKVGRWLGAQQRHGIEGIYWGLYGLGGSASVAGAGIDAIPQAPGVTLAGSPASAFLAGSSAQSIARTDTVNDVEINWLYRVTDRPEFAAPGQRVAFQWLAGFRFFQLEDVLTQVSTSSSLPPSPSGANRALLSVATDNDIYGAQAGFQADWRIAPRLRLSAVPKMMIGGNAVTNTTTLATVSGASATFAGGAPVDVHATADAFSWLGSVDAGAAWDVTDRWSLWLGYRVVGVGNVALADSQWPSTLAAPAALESIETGSGTLLHGGYAGFQGRW